MPLETVMCRSSFLLVHDYLVDHSTEQPAWVGHFLSLVKGVAVLLRSGTWTLV